MTEYLEIIHLYRLPIIAGMTAAVTLALLGSQLAALDKSIQSVFLSQIASFGTVIGLAIVLTYTERDSSLREVIPLAIAGVFSFLGFFQSEELIEKYRSSKSTVLIVLYAALLAATYLVTSLIPALESHMTRVFFGDLATLSDAMSIATIFVSVVVFFFLITNYRKITNLAFDEMVLNISPRGQKKKLKIIFQITTVTYICFTTQAVGFLFTISLLFVPTVITLITSRVGLRFHLRAVTAVSVLGVVLGFLIAMSATSVPTVPTIVLTLLVVGVMVPWF